MSVKVRQGDLMADEPRHVAECQMRARSASVLNPATGSEAVSLD